METGVKERIHALAARSAVTAISLDCERLSALDDLWTIYLGEEHDVFDLEADFPSLQRLVGEIVDLLSSVAVGSRVLKQLVIEFPSDLDRELELLLEEHPARDRLLENRLKGPLAENVVEACEVIERDTPAAIFQLATKLQALSQGEFTPGDIPQRLKCAVLVAGIGASALAFCASPGALIALPVAVVTGAGLGGIAASGLAAIRGWDCKGEGPEPATA